MTQAQRVLLALRRAGDRGITAHDFYATPVDNGPRISRVAARVLDLRAQGHVIVPAGERDGHRVYVLVGAAGVAPREAKGAADCEQAGSAPVDSAGALSVRPAASPQPSPSSSPGSASGAAPTTPAHPPAVPAPLHRSVLPRTPSSRTAPESPGKPDAAASGEPRTLFDTTALRQQVGHYEADAA